MASVLPVAAWRRDSIQSSRRCNDDQASASAAASGDTTLPLERAARKVALAAASVARSPAGSPGSVLSHSSMISFR
jgi:hypothetical protein